MNSSLVAILELFQTHQVDAILIGGWAALMHGSSRVTQDYDFVYSRDPRNRDSLIAALSPYQPYLRGAPPGLPFFWDRRTLDTGINFTLRTTLGDLDLLAEVPGNGSYESLLPDSLQLTVHGVPVRVVTLARLIELKIASGRPKDLEAIAELKQLSNGHDDVDRAP
jgi:hypothetical protein